MARSDVDMCNVALGMVGGKRISSLIEDLTNARLCSTFYPSTVDEVLCMYEWGCAKHTKIITSDAGYDTDTFDYGYNYRFALPVNPYCLKIRKFNDGITEYDKQGRFLYTNVNSCELVYTKRITDTNEFDPMLAEAISLQLGIKLSFPLQAANQLRIELIEYLEAIVLHRAKTADAAERYVDEKGKHSWRKAGR